MPKRVTGAPLALRKSCSSAESFGTRCLFAVSGLTYGCLEDSFADELFSLFICFAQLMRYAARTDSFSCPFALRTQVAKMHKLKTAGVE
jgi:hypothetical protein